jgi:hypothetical protein
MNTLFTFKNRTMSARFVAVVTLVSMILSAFPAAFLVAQAQNVEEVQDIVVLVDYCDPSQRPNGKSIAEWHAENQFDSASCFAFDVDNQCGSLDVQFNTDETGLGFAFNYVLGTETPELADFAGDGIMPVSFSEDENGGSVDVTFYAVGPESEFLTGTGIPNIWDGNGTTVSVNTDCEKDEPKTSDLRVCKIIVDENGDIVTGAGLETDFSVTLTGPDSYEETVTFSTELNPNTDLLVENGDADDAECVVLEDVVQGDYYYDEEDIEGDGVWLTPLYHDFFSEEADMLSDFGELAPVGTDGKKNHDGHIVLKNKARTLALLNRLEPKPPLCVIGENLLKNGSFEEPVVTDDKKWRYTSIVDWVITALSDEEEQDGELHRGWSGNQAADGEQYAELDSRESVEMSQTVDTIEGATYELKWAFAPRHNIDADENQLAVLVDGGVVATEGPATLPSGLTSGDWTRNSYEFTADSDETTVSFADAGANSDTFGTFLDDTALCLVREPQPEVTVHTSKIVCEDESDLPNWGTGGPKIDENTAIDWVNDPDNDSCQIVDGWEFEWAPKNTNNPDDDLPEEPFYGQAGGNWTTFTDSITIPISDLGGSHFWMREVLQEEYIPFTFGPGNKTNENDYSAEFYCHTDVLNYDNYDRIDNPQEDGEYYCVGWNVPEEPPVEYGDYCGDGVVNQEWEQCDGTDGCTEQCQLAERNQCTDLTLAKIDIFEVDNLEGGTGDMTDDQYVGQDATAIPNDTWFAVYWNGSYFNDPDVVGYEDVPGLAVQRLDSQVRAVMHGSATNKDKEHANGEVEFWSWDDSVDADSVDSDNSGNNKLEGDFTDGSGIGSKKAGDDEIEIDGVVAKFWITTTTADDGFYVTYSTPVVCEECEDELEGGWADWVEDSNQGKEKNGDDITNPDRTNPDAVLGEADWTPGGNTGFFSLGFGGFVEVSFDNYVPNLDGDDISVHEATNGDNYPLETAKVEVSQDGSTWYELSEEATNDKDEGGTNVTLLDFDETGLDWIKYVRVTDTTDSEPHQNSADGFDVDAIDAVQTLCEMPDPEKYLIDGYKNGEYLRQVEVRSLVLGGNGLPNWTIELYDGDENFITSTTTDDDGYYYFWVPEGEYEVKEVIKPGWEQVGVDDGGNYVFPDEGPHSCMVEFPLDDDHDLPVFNSISLVLADQLYKESDYRCNFYNRLVPQEGYSIHGFKYEVDGESDIPRSGWNIIASNGESSTSTVTDENGEYWFVGLPAGDWTVSEVIPNGWSQVEVQQNFSPVDSDRCSFSLGGGDELVNLNELQVTELIQIGNRCDFYNEQDSDPEPEPRRSSSSGGSRSTQPEPEVAGAATMCPFLEDHMQKAWDNDPFEVMKLQMFLNIIMGETLTVDGVFGIETDAAVKRFQERYRSEVLTPWFELGIVPHNEPTGFVYKTTRWKINDIVCPGFEPYPSFDGEDLTSNVVIN